MHVSLLSKGYIGFMTVEDVLSCFFSWFGCFMKAHYSLLQLLT